MRPPCRSRGEPRQGLPERRADDSRRPRPARRAAIRGRAPASPVDRTTANGHRNPQFRWDPAGPVALRDPRHFPSSGDGARLAGGRGMRRSWFAGLLVASSVLLTLPFGQGCAEEPSAPSEPAVRDGDLVRGLLGTRSVTSDEDRSAARAYDAVGDAIVGELDAASPGRVTRLERELRSHDADRMVAATARSPGAWAAEAWSRRASSRSIMRPPRSWATPRSSSASRRKGPTAARCSSADPTGRSAMIVAGSWARHATPATSSTPRTGACSGCCATSTTGRSPPLPTRVSAPTPPRAAPCALRPAGRLAGPGLGRGLRSARGRSRRGAPRGP